MSTHIRKIVAASLCALTLASCSTGKKEAIEKYDEAKKHTVELRRDWESHIKARALRRVQVVDALYLAPHARPQVHGDPIPEDWIVGSQTFTIAKPTTLQEVANELRDLLGIIVTVDVAPRAARREERIEGETDVERFREARESGDFDTLAFLSVTKRIDLRGSREKILDHIAAIFDVAWKYERGAVRFQRYVTEVFELHALEGLQTFDTSIGASSGGGSSGGEGGSGGGSGGSISASVGYTYDSYELVQNSLVSSILPANATAEILPNTGGIVVTAPAYIMSDVRRFIKQQNDILTRTIAVEVSVYAVTKDKSNTSAASVDLVVSDLANTFGVDFRSTEFTADASGARLSGGIITPPPGSFLSPFAGSQFIAQSFSEIGRVNTAIRETRYVRSGKASVFTTGTEQLFIRNNRIAPIGTEANQANAQGTETETLNTGFTMAVRGRAANDGTIFLNVRISIRDLIRFETLNASGVRSPIVDENEIDEDLHLAPGEIVILKSFTRTANRIAERRGGNVVCSFWCFDDVAENEIQEFYVVVKATLLAKPRAFRAGR